MHRRFLASLVALAIGGTSLVAAAQTSGLRADEPSSSDVRVGEIDSAARAPSSDAAPLERVVVRDHRSRSREDRGNSEDHRRDGDKGDKSLKDKVKEEIKEKVKEKAKEKLEKEKEKIKDRVEKEKDKIKDRVEKEKDKLKDKVKDVIGDFW